MPSLSLGAAGGLKAKGTQVWRSLWRQAFDQWLTRS